MILTKLGHKLCAALDMLLPPRCAGTGETVDAAGTVSAAFWAQLDFIEAPFCATCGLPFALDVPDGTICAACMDTPPDFDHARAPLAYNDALRKLVLDFKYGDRLHIVDTFVPWLVRAGQTLLQQTDVIVPVPLHRKRLWWRRYNQSAIIARTLSQKSGIPWLPDTLERLRHTPPQKGLNRKQRAENVKDAFDLHQTDRVSGKNILLVDDVFTSGATLNACARTLKKHNAAKVFVLTVARVTRDYY